jgi:hypothetical protein
MAAQQFDKMARSLAAAGSRRGLLQAIALALGAALATLVTEEGETGRRRRRRKARHRPGKNKDNRKGKRKGRTKDKGDCSRCTATQKCVSGEFCQDCDVCASGCPFDNVQAAIDEAEAGETIHICAGTYGPTGIVVANVTKNLTLIGAGDGADEGNTILDLMGASGSVVLVNGPTLTLRALRLTGAQGGLAGGGVYVDNGSAVTLIDCTVTGNSTELLGAGILILNGIVTLIGCQVTGNSAGDDGTGQGGGIFNAGTITLDASSVSDNSAGDDGGGIYNNGGTVDLLNGSSVSGNSPNDCAPPGSVPGCGG